MFIGDVRSEVAVTTIGQFVDVRDVLHDRDRSAVAGLEGTDMEARRVRRMMSSVDATVQFVGEIDPHMHFVQPNFTDLSTSCDLALYLS
jgi:site-specific recombinase XerC